MGKNKAIDIILLFLPLFIIGVLFYIVGLSLNGNYFTFIDSTAVYGRTFDLNTILNLWNPNNLGYLNTIHQPISFFSKILSILVFHNKLDISTQTVVYYFLITSIVFYFSLFSFYKIQVDIYRKEGLSYPVLIASFYSFGLPMIVQQGIIDTTFHIWAIAPLYLSELLGIIINQIEIITPRRVILLALITSVMLSAPPFSFSILLVTVFSLLIFKFNEIKIKRTKYLKYIILYLACTLMFGSIFIFPYVYSLISIKSGTFYSSNGGAIGYIFSDTGLNGLFRFDYDWTRSLYHKTGNNHPYYNYYDSIFGIVGTIGVWILIFYFINRRQFSIEQKKIAMFLLICTSLSLTLIKGIKPPFQDFNKLLYDFFPVLNLFRTPGSKFGVPILLYIALFLQLIVINTQNKIFRNLIIVLVILNIVPFFNPKRFIGYNENEYIVTVPRDYTEVTSIVNESADGSIIFYPGNFATYFNTGDKLYLGQDVVGKIVKVPVIYSDEISSPVAQNRINEIYKLFDPKKLGDTSIRYVILRRDISNINADKNIVNTLNSNLGNNDFNRIFKSNLLDIYRVTDKYFKEIITIESEGQPIISEYSKISNTFYRVKFTLPNEHQGKKLKLIFRNSFNKDWKVEGVNMNNGMLQVVGHKKYQGYANEWEFKSYQDYNSVDVYFAPQRIYNILILVIAAVIVILIILIIFKKI